MIQREERPETAAAHPEVTVSRAAARRFLLYQQGLLPGPSSPWRGLRAGPAGTLRAIRQLECVQIDPVKTVAQNHHLVLANRIHNYQPEHLERLLAAGRVFEHMLQARCVIPSEDLAYFRPRFQEMARALEGRWQTVRATGEEILAHIRSHGPATTRTFAGTDKVVGYWDRAETPNTRASNLALEILWETGRLVLSARSDNQRYYDVPERIMAPDLLRQFAAMPETEAWRALRLKYYRGYRLFDTGDFRFGWRHQPVAERRAAIDEDLAAGIIMPVTMDGVKRRYYVLTEDAPLLREAETWAPGSRAAFLSPLDNLLWRRTRVEDLFDFRYTWEQYTPAAKRQFGHYAMPVLFGDRLVGRIDPRFDRETGTLVVNRLALEPGVHPSRALARGLNAAAARLLDFLGGATVRFERVEPAELRTWLE